MNADSREEMEARFDAFYSKVEGRIRMLDDKVTAEAEKNELRFKLIDERFDRIDERFDRIDERFERIDERFDRQDERFDRMDGRFDRLDGRFEKQDASMVDMRERQAQLMTRLENAATKADLQASTNSTIKWVAGTSIALAASAITVMTFVLNNATPKMPVAQPAPIVIVVPVQPGATGPLPPAAR